MGCFRIVGVVLVGFSLLSILLGSASLHHATPDLPDGGLPIRDGGYATVVDLQGAKDGGPDGEVIENLDLLLQLELLEHLDLFQREPEE